MLNRSKKRNGCYFWVNGSSDEIRYVAVKASPKVNWKTHIIWRSLKNVKCIDSFHGNNEILGAGSSTGNISLLSVKHPEFQAVVTPGYARPCNSLAFSETEHLVAGFAKSRNESSLKLWDLNSLLSDPKSSPLMQSSTLDGVSSVCYKKDTPLLLTGSTSRSVHIIDTRQQLDSVSSVNTQYYSNIVVDPFSPNYFAANSYDGDIAIFDTRYFKSDNYLQIILRNENKKPKNPQLFALKYSEWKPGQLAVLSNNLITLRQLLPCVNGNEGSANNSVFVNYEKKYPVKPNSQCSGIDFFTPSTAFPTHVQILGVINEQPKLFSVHDEVIPFSFNPYNDLIFSFKEKLYPLNSSPLNTLSDVPQFDVSEFVDENSFDSSSSCSSKVFLTTRNNSINSEDSAHEVLLSYNRVLGSDIQGTILDRVKKGYQFDSQKNSELVSDLYLKDLWSWIHLSHRQSEESLFGDTGDTDFSYQGALGIWFMDTELTSMSDVFEAKESKFLEKKILRLARDVIERLDLDIFTSIQTKRPLRQLALLACGLGMSNDDLLLEIGRLIRKNEHVKAAGLALFHGKIENVVRILSSGNELEKTISTAVAGYITSQGLSNFGSDSLWKEMSRNLSTELEDPYLRAIFAYVSNSDWRDVLDEVSLSLKDRLGIALRFLPDDDLSNYLCDLCHTTVQSGDPEGLLLTGLTPLGMELLQNYIDHTSDVQTAALIAAFVVPKKFLDKRAEDWTESYRELLNRWKLYRERAKFDIFRTELSKNHTGEITRKATEPSIRIICNFCRKPIFPFSNRNECNNLPTPIQRGVSKAGPAKHLGKSCPHCGQPLPKCSVCGFSLGDEDVPQKDDFSQKPQNYVKEVNLQKSRFGLWFSFCLNCGHGAHASHASEWFSTHTICPVPNCDCECKLK
ncbi:Ubiquitin-protein ligase E3 [Schizosaccharomyces pombe]